MVGKKISIWILLAGLPGLALAQEELFNTEQSVVPVEESELIQRIKRQLDYGYDYVFDNLLHCNPENGELEQALNLLGKHQISINDRNTYGQTLLSKAFYTSSISYGKRIPFIKQLLQHGADLSIKDDSGRTPLQDGLNGYHLSREEKLMLIELALAQENAADLSTDILAFPLTDSSIEDSTRINVIEAALKLGANPNAPILRQYQPAEYPLAALVSSYSIEDSTKVKLLNLFLQYGADPFLLDENGDSLLDRAYHYNHAIQQHLRALGVGPGLRNQMVNALKMGNLEQVTALLNTGVNVNLEMSYYLKKPLSIAVEFGHMDIASYLIEHGADVDSETLWNDAIARGSLETFLAFKEYWNEPYDKDVLLEEATGGGRTEFNSDGHYDIVAQLIEEGADIHVTNGGVCPLVSAARSGSKKTVLLLLSHGANMYQKGKKPYTEGHYELAPLATVQRGNIEILRIFLEQGFDPNEVANTNGETIAHAAAMVGATNILALIESYGGSLERTDNQGKTPIMLAIASGHIEAMVYLARRGVDINTQDTHGNTPRTLAREKGLEEALINASESGDIDLNLIPQRLQLRLMWTLEGQAGLQRLVNQGKTLIGLLTTNSTPEFDVHINGDNQYAHVIIGYTNPDMLNNPGVFKLFSGFIVPGADDSFTEGEEHYTAQDIAENPLPTEAFYQKMIPLILESKKPIIGMCAGAQHLMMAHGGMIVPADGEDNNEPILIDPYTWQHFMMLSKEEREHVLETCETEPIQLEVYRVHTYAVHPESVKEQGFELASSSRVGDVMAYSKDFRTVVTQFHPENFYKNEHTLNGESDRNYLNGFIELCIDHDRWVRAAKNLGMGVEHMLELRDTHFQKMHDRLKECRAAESDVA